MRMRRSQSSASTTSRDCSTAGPPAEFPVDALRPATTTIAKVSTDMSQPLGLSNRAGAPYDWETSVRTLGQKLATTELLPADRLRAYRAPLVASLLGHAQKTTSFYKDRIDFDVASPGPLDRI